MVLVVRLDNTDAIEVRDDGQGCKIVFTTAQLEPQMGNVPATAVDGPLTMRDEERMRFIWDAWRVATAFAREQGLISPRDG